MHSMENQDNLSVDSNINVFSPRSSESDEDERLKGVSKGVTLKYNQRIVLELLDDIFDDQKGDFEASSSLCSSKENTISEYSFDKRLKYWKDILEERKKISTNIQNKTGKNCADVLFNRPTTAEIRDKQSVKRVIDYAERMHPLSLLNKKKLTLPEYIDDCCRHIKELRETLPRAEREQKKTVEIIGVPNAVKEEIIGSASKRVFKKSPWFKSNVLRQRVDERREDIERVIPFYPVIDKLQVIGKSLLNREKKDHNPQIQLVECATPTSVSSDTSMIANMILLAEAINKSSMECVPEYSIKVNDFAFNLRYKLSNRNVEVETQFECEPYQKVTKRVLRVENIGRKVLHCELSHRSFYDDCNTELFKCKAKEFTFNKKAFRVIAGEVVDVVVQFHPYFVNILKEKWLLKVDPPFFCRKSDSIIIKLIGHCKPSSIYTRKLDTMQDVVIEKSNINMMRQLTSRLASLTPMIQPAEVTCPYKRTLDERELFELYNNGYICDRYHDLELLKNIYNRIKKPREPTWDLRLESLRKIVFRLESADRRALVYNEMMGILMDMKGTPAELDEKVCESTERNHVRLLYVRCAVATCIDDWEQLTASVEEVFLQPLIKKHYLMLEEDEEEEEFKDKEKENFADGLMGMLFIDEELVRENTLKKLQRRKTFRDSMYMQTYTHLCNCVEDIVSIIESTEIL